MIPLAKLKAAAQEGLDYLKTMPDIKEAEVFVASNGNLLTRLNYTSHIPSNGVEEPKSTESYGVGIRVAFQTPEGVKTAFGSEPSDVSIEGVKKALDKARKGAVLDREFVSLPKPTRERPTLARYHDRQTMNIRDGDLSAMGWAVVEGALDAFQASEDLLSVAGSRERLKDLGLILGGDVTLLQERMAIASYSLPVVQTDESTLIMSFVTAMIESQFSKGSSWSAGSHLAEFSSESGREAARNAIQSMGGIRVRDGEYKVIFGPQAVTDIVVNLILPGLSLGLFYAGASPFQAKLTRQVASDAISIFDAGNTPGLAGSKRITCEGLPTGRTELVKNGILVGLMSNFYEYQRMLNDPKGAEKLGVSPREHQSALTPRNGFRFARGGGRHFDAPPFIAATNTVIEGSQPKTRDELLRLAGDGLYIGRIWYTYPINGIAAGDFTCTMVGDSYLIKDGRLSTPLKPNTIRINDSIHNVLNNIIGIGREHRGTLVWAADSIVYAPEIAVRGVHVKEIAEYMEAI